MSTLSEPARTQLPAPTVAAGAVAGPAGTAQSVVATGRGRRVTLLDRPWLGSWTSVLVGPVSLRPVDEIRAVVRALFERSPDHALISRLDPAAGRWRPVRAEDARAYCERVVTVSPDPAPGETDAFLLDHTPPAGWPAPFHLLLGARTATLYISHAYGDAVTVARTLNALVTADLDELVAVEPRAHCGTLATTLVPELVRRRPRYRRPPAAEARGEATGATRADSDEAHIASQVVDNAGVRALMRWRNQHAAGVALSSLLTSAMYLSLVREGLPIDSSGYYGLVDVRRYLRPADQNRAGNLAKSLFVRVDPGDPRAVEAAFAAILESGWALPSTLYGSLVSAWPPVRNAGPTAPTTATAGAPIALSFSIMPNLPGIGSLPWADGPERRFIGAGSAEPGPSLNIFAVRLRSHLELAATFRTGWVPAARVRAALTAMADPVAILASARAGQDGPGHG